MCFFFNINCWKYCRKAERIKKVGTPSLMNRAVRFICFGKEHFSRNSRNWEINCVYYFMGSCRVLTIGTPHFYHLYVNYCLEIAFDVIKDMWSLDLMICKFHQEIYLLLLHAITSWALSIKTKVSNCIGNGIGDIAAYQPKPAPKAKIWKFDT